MTNFISTPILFLLVVLNLSLLQVAAAQDVESFFSDIKDRIQNDPVKVTGGISAGSNFSQTNGIQNRFDPFNWNLNANINFDILGIKAPFSLNYSNGNSTYNLPSYQFYGISPSYKWIKLHFGDRSMSFSPYSLAGHNFFGTGIELSPGKFRLSAMYGRLKRATATDLNNLSNIDPSFKRMGWGFKTGYVGDRDEIFFTFFTANDDPNTYIPINDDFILNAKENVVIELNGKKHFGKKLFFTFDVARSAYTSDLATAVVDTETGFLKNYGGIIESRSSTGYYNALKGGIGLNATKTTSIQLNYERIDPGYRTLGALFFNDDLENFTVSTSTSIFKSKVNISGSIGLQRDNLSGFESNTNNRLIGNVNATYAPTERVVFNGGYSNFRNTSRVKFTNNPFSPVDSISLALVNQNSNISASYTLGKEKNAMLTTMFTYQTANSIMNEEVLENQNTDFYIGNINYAYTFINSKLTLSSGIMGNYSLLPNVKTFFFAPTLSASKKFLNDQLSSSASIAYSSVYLNEVFANRVFNFRAQFGYAFFENHNINLSTGLIQRTAESSGSPVSFYEFIANINYRYNFNLGGKK